ncbi:MAG: FKBP-type peptidyl-prolyl cis-trans isomerase [Bacteroidales bacterium]|nr:FKBP-type peptidyl-prolyl cis-trans isomerase [Candidatus Liminaster caballi]
MAKQKSIGPWRQQNAEFMNKISQDPEARNLGAGVYYKVLATGNGDHSPQQFSVVTCHYKGSLVTGKVFDNSYERGCPEAFRCRDLIAGFTLALLHMKVGDRWEVYIPYDQGYGTRNNGPIPAYSTLIFEIELISIA